MRNSVVCGRPLGEGVWLEKKIREYGLEHTTRLRGRPQKEK